MLKAKRRFLQIGSNKEKKNQHIVCSVRIAKDEKFSSLTPILFHSFLERRYVLLLCCEALDEMFTLCLMQIYRISTNLHGQIISENSLAEFLLIIFEKSQRRDEVPENE